MQSAVQPEPPRSESPRSFERQLPRRLGSTPLQNSQVSSPITESSTQSSPRDLATSPTSSRGGSGLSYSPRSPQEVPLMVQLPPMTSREELLSTQTSLGGSNDGSPVDATSKSSPLATPRADNRYQVRNVSAPFADTQSGSSKPTTPHSPSENGTLRGKPNMANADQRLAPRGSSIDSTLSSNSSATTYSQLSSDPMSPNPAEIAQMIANAGSAEAVISHLCKERKQAANQNAQLFRLVQKQRSLIYGLNQDLEKAVKEKEKYRKRLRDDSAHMSPARGAKVDALRRDSPAASTSSTLSEDELPIQRHSTAEDDGKPAEPISDMPLEGRDLGIEVRIGSNVEDTAPRSAPPVMSPRQEHTLKAEEPESRRNTLTQSPLAPVAPLSINKRTGTGRSDEDIQEPIAQSPNSFAARRSFNNPRKVSNASALSAQSPTDELAAMSPSTRKGPPAPLNLGKPPIQVSQSPKSPQDYGPEDHSGSDYGNDDELDEITGLKRGRKKTRAEDDHERELLIQREQESRSASKKQKGSKPGSKNSSIAAKDGTHLDPSQHPLPKSPSIQGFAPVSPAISMRSSHLSPHASIAGMLSGPPSSTQSTFNERKTVIAPGPTSPGLPASPRPIDRPSGVLSPRQPREGYITSPPPSTQPPKSPLEHQIQQQQPNSPKAPPAAYGPSDPPNLIAVPRSPVSQPIEQAPRSPRFDSLPQAPRSPKPQRPKSPPAAPQSPRKTSDSTSIKSQSVPQELKVDGVFRGLVSEEHPNLLLPPNALPSIAIKVTSSRLKPSRHSMLITNGMQQEEPVFTLGITARSNLWQLWRVEKPILSLPQLDFQLRQVSDMDVKLPDRSLFSGHSPAKIDARREALEKYFEALLETQMSEKAALIMCQYFSNQVVPAEDTDHVAGAPDFESRVADPEGTVIKEGYLTKRGKQFGGWKARYFVLDDSVLRYYDAPGGSLQGTIKLFKAQIGRQTGHQSHSPQRDAQNPDSQFRHAFLILEPKKKDSGNHVRHVLCAESDRERDEWVFALLQYVNTPVDEPKVRPSGKRSESSSKGSLKAVKRGADDTSSLAESERFDTLQGVSYEDTAPGQAPIHTDIVPTRDPASLAHTNLPNNLQVNTNVGGSTISAPRNGAIIQDAGAWGNRSAESSKREKEQKKRSIWGFRDRIAEIGSHSNNSNTNVVTPSATTPRTPHTARKDNHVFGVPLREAVEFCMVPGSNLCLPAVVYRCIEYLDAKNAADEEGIFRLSGSNVVIKQLKEKFDTLGDFDFLADDIYWDVHAVASLLKLYLRELPNTVLTRELNPLFLDALDIEDKQERILTYNALVHKLPLPNWTLVRALSQYLLTIINNSQVNKMSVRNVGIVFAPTLNVPAPVFSAFLTDFEPIFVAEPLPSAASIYVQPASPDDQRSAITPGPQAQHFNHAPAGQHHESPHMQHGGRRTPVQGGQATPIQTQNPGGRSTPVGGYHNVTPAHHSPMINRSGSPTHSAHNGQDRHAPGSAAAAPRSPNMHASSNFNQPREMQSDRTSIMGRPSYETNVSFDRNQMGGSAPPHQYKNSPQNLHSAQGLPSGPQGGQGSGPNFARPSYETRVDFGGASMPPPSGPPPALPRASIVGPPDRPKYASGLGATELMRDAKARRRESSLIMMGNQNKRKSSMPAMGNMPESVAE